MPVTPPPRPPCFSLSHLLMYHIPTGSAAAEAPGVVTDYASGPSDLPLLRIQDTSLPTLCMQQRCRDDDNVRTYTVTPWWTSPPSTPLVSLHCQIIWRCLYGVRIRGFLPGRRDYVRIRLQLHHFPPPIRGGDVSW